MPLALTIGAAFLLIIYILLQILLHATQDAREPRLAESKLPFCDSIFGIAKQQARYLASLSERYDLPIQTLRMPFQRLYIVHAPQLIHVIQSKANAKTLVPNLLDFGMLFSGLNLDSQTTLRQAFGTHGNGFTMSVHKYLLSGDSLKTATKAAIDRLTASLSNSMNDTRVGLQEFVRHELTLAMTGAIYGPENPYDDPVIEQSWRDFLPGISHLLYSPAPALTARKAMCARGRIICAFKKYFETGGHLQAFPMVPEMHELNKNHGLSTEEAAKMEMATSLAMLSSGAVTAFWLLFHILSARDLNTKIREELKLLALANNTEDIKTIKLSAVKNQCPTLIAVLNETLRYHSTVINIKQVQHDTTLDGQYLLKKDGLVMIPGQSVHLNKDIWGPSANVFDHDRFMNSQSKKNIASTSVFRPFGAGTTMCPGRHFSTNVILSMVAIILLRYDIAPISGDWKEPTKRNADMWNAMPKPDYDIDVMLMSRSAEQTEWKFAWD